MFSAIPVCLQRYKPSEYRKRCAAISNRDRMNFLQLNFGKVYSKRI
jgi:hypothetical protein